MFFIFPAIIGDDFNHVAMNQKQFNTRFQRAFKRKETMTVDTA